MNRTTIRALEDVSRMLHDAGWAASAEDFPIANEAMERRVKKAFDTLLRSDHQEIIDKVLVRKQAVSQAGQELGMDEAAANALFHEALARLADFAELIDQHGADDSRPSDRVRPRSHSLG